MNEFGHARSGSTIDDLVRSRTMDVQNDLFQAFLACRTTLEDLSDRAAALGQHLSGSVIAAHLTGTTALPDGPHNVLADAINARLGELSLPPTAPYQDALRRDETARAASRATQHTP